MMVFGAKPKKTGSFLPQDKRKLSLLNTDFKLITAIEANRFKQLTTHTLSPTQLAAGNDRRIHHGINRIRDAVHSMSGSREGCGILANDYKSAFDFLSMGRLL